MCKDEDVLLDLDEVNGMSIGDYISFDPGKYGSTTLYILNKERDFKYLNYGIEYPDYQNCSLSYGVEFMYVPDTYLNNILASELTIPLSAYLLNRYRKWDDPFNEAEDWPLELPFMSEAAEEFIFHFNTKRDAYHAVLHPKNKLAPSFRLSMLQDDIEILAKSDAIPNEYYYFYYDQDNSDCSIGKFLTDDSEDLIVKEFDRHVNYHSDFRHGVGPAQCLPLNIFGVTRKW